MESLGKKVKVDDRLSNVVSHFYMIEIPEEMPSQVHHLSPSLEMMVVFNFGTKVSFSFGTNAPGERTIDKIGILGPLRRMMNYEVSGGADLLILPFVYDGFFRLFSIPVNGLDTKALTEGDAIIHSQHLKEIWQLLSIIPVAEKRVAILTEYLIQNLKQSESAVLPLLDGEPDLHNPSLNAVRTIADKASLTERTIQLRFKKYTGYSPKELVRFLRFKQVLAFVLANSKDKINWLDVTVEFGYHDQSHLIKDFKYFMGVSPKQFIKLNNEGDICVSRD